MASSPRPSPPKEERKKAPRQCMCESEGRFLMNAEEMRVAQTTRELPKSLPVDSAGQTKAELAKSSSSSKRVLEPIERISEVLFGLIMVLTFTCSFSVAEAGRGEVRTMLLAALGCNLAWG